MGRRGRNCLLRSMAVAVVLLTNWIALGSFRQGEIGSGDWSIFLPEANGKDLIVTGCFNCHDLARVVKLRGGKDFWDDLIASMAAQGAQFSNSEAEAMTEYLSVHLGPDQEPLAVPININTAKLAVLRLLSPIADRAEEIVKLREQGKTFVTPDDLLIINGITKEKIAKIKPFVSVK